MDIATFHASRRFADVKSGRIAYVEQGEGPAALFIHGVPLNGHHWRHVVSRLRHRRRCIAIDLMGLGYTEIAPSQDISFISQAHMVAEVIDALGVRKVDLIANDSGGAIAQIFAAHYPGRLNSLVLTNRYAKGESVPLFRAYADPSVLTDEILRLYLNPLLSSPQRIEAFQNYWLAFDNTQTVSIHAALKTLQVPTLIVWGLDDFFFDRKWAHWLKNTIPGARRVVEIEDARLFFAEDRPDALSAPVLDFWDELEKT
jgi:pimeloyl-ACP methyl ester carboxylesterase